MFFSIDATNESFSQGRMVNDATPGDPMLNAEMKIVIVEKIPHLCWFAFRNIECNEEICYDYGIPNLSWRKVILFAYCNVNRHIDINIDILIYLKYFISTLVVTSSTGGQKRVTVVCDFVLALLLPVLFDWLRSSY